MYPYIFVYRHIRFVVGKTLRWREANGETSKRDGKEAEEGFWMAMFCLFFSFASAVYQKQDVEGEKDDSGLFLSL